MITNYGELKTAIADWINRKDLTDRIPDFIQFGESSIFKGLQTNTGNLALRCREGLVATELTPVEGVIAIPTDFLELVEVTMDGVGKTPISAQFYNRLRLYTGQTAVFSMRNDDWYQYPASDTDDTFDIIYFADFTGTLVNDLDTNPILTAYPDIYLFAALDEAEMYIKNDSRTTWRQKLESNVRAANATYRRAKYSGATPAQRTQYREVQSTRTVNQGSQP